MANYYNVFIHAPWTVINVEPSINFDELFIQIKSGVFLTISTSLELSSSVLDSVKTRLLLTRQSIVRLVFVACLVGMLNLLYRCTRLAKVLALIL